MARLLRVTRFRSFEGLDDTGDRVEAVLGQTAAKVVSTGLSVYAHNENDTLRILSEHVVTFTQPGTKSGLYLDVPYPQSLQPVKTAGRTLFAYANGQHRDLRFVNCSEVECLIQRWWRARPHIHQHDRKEIRAYVEARLLEGDAEWLNARSAAASGSKPCPRWFP